MPFASRNVEQESIEFVASDDEKGDMAITAAP
jgi:hypothetical protein